MPRKAKAKARKAKRSPVGKRQAKRSGRRALRKPAARRSAISQPFSPPGLSREVVEEILLLSAKSSEGEQLSDRAVLEIATSASLDPESVLDAHRRLCEANDEPDIAILRVIEISDAEE
jgi:hypothetical protein